MTAIETSNDVDATTESTGADPASRPLGRLPILTVLHPRDQTRLVVVAGSIALVASTVARLWFGWQLWQAVALVLFVMVVPGAVTWRATALRFGGTAAVAAALISVQGLHSLEHAAQWAQRHVMDSPLRQSNGLLSPANSEWVHFVWNWAVVATVVVLFARGMRSGWGWAALLWATAHALEHTYMWVRFLQVGAELTALGQGGVTAQGLPGVVGRNGWLDVNRGSTLQFVCDLRFVTTADRVDAHFAWNTGEILLLLPAVHVLLRRRPG